MSFEENNGVFEVKLNNGDVVRFESAEEMAAAKAMHEEFEALFGREKKVVTEWPVVKAPKKKIQIHIDPEVEFVGTPSTTSQAKRSPSLGDGGMKKALA